MVAGLTSLLPFIRWEVRAASSPGLVFFRRRWDRGIRQIIKLGNHIEDVHIGQLGLLRRLIGKEPGIS